MSKINIKYTLKTNEKQINKSLLGFINDRKIVFRSDGDTFHLTKDLFVKENDESLLTIDLNNEKCTYFLKQYKKEVSLDIKLESYLFLKDRYYIKYKLDDSFIELELIYEVIQ